MKKTNRGTSDINKFTNMLLEWGNWIVGVFISGQFKYTDKKKKNSVHVLLYFAFLYNTTPMKQIKTF